MIDFSSYSKVRLALDSGQTDVCTLVDYFQKAIYEKRQLNAFIEIFPDLNTKATIVDQKVKNGKAGKLAGMIIGVKDVLCIENQKVTAGSKILHEFTSPYTATAIQRLMDEDAIIIGRQNCDEFAMGSSNESSVYGPALNAADNSRVPGGSSGGSAVAVQANLCMVSIGSDTGGSVRQPGSFCGVVGLKPTYGRISRYGLIAYASSFDCIGPITKSVADAKLLFEIMAGFDPKDSSSSSQPHPPGKPTKRIACFGKDIPELQPEIRETLLLQEQKLRMAGWETEWIDLPYQEYLLPTYYILTTAEASSNLSRFDGIRYGFRAENQIQVDALMKKSRSEGFGKEVKKRILLGTFSLSADYQNAYYTKAQKSRRLIQNSAVQIFQQFDALLMPTTPTSAFLLGEKADPLAMYYADIFTVWANLTGVPAIHIPTGKDKMGLPIGIQIHSGWFQENMMMEMAEFLESQTL